MWPARGVPVGEADIQRLLRMEEALRQQVVGQDDAVRRVSKAVRRAAAGLKDPKRPVATLIFLGPGGACKNQLARALAGFLYGDDTALVRLEMSKYRGERALADLLGTSSGGGELDEAVRRRPESVIVFNDIEQAHRDVFDVFFEMRDEGVIRAGHQPATDIRDSVVVACTNVGLDHIPPHAGQYSAEEWPRVLSEVIAGIERAFPLGFWYRCHPVLFHAEPVVACDGPTTVATEH